MSAVCGRDGAGEVEAESQCDIVMKGGITSGVVYPRAICRLSEQYRFRNVGGTSAGAIAAAATAAAEHGRLQGAGGGFTRLEAVPNELGDGALLGLFQPQARTARLHAVMVAAISAKGVRQKLKRGGLAALSGYRLAAVLGALPAVVLAAGLPVAAILTGSSAVMTIVAFVYAVLGLVLAALAAALAVVACLAREVNLAPAENGFGLCSGMPGEGDGSEALTPWLHRTIQECAGRTTEGKPLVFGDLWSPKDPENPPIDPDDRAVNLAMMTTNLVNRRGHELPWDGGGWYFSPEEFSRLFPPEVVKQMVDHPRDLPKEKSERWESRLRREEALSRGLRPLPEGKHLPVLVATRLSLSFPVLLGAVPLWQFDKTGIRNVAVLDRWREWAKGLAKSDHERVLEDPGTWEAHGAPRERPQPDRCWFSDGGISSNFPIHFFDRPVPRWPTFGIDLRPFPLGREPSSSQADNVEVATSNSALIADWWYRFPEPSSKFFGFGDGRMAAFLGSIVKTMQGRTDEAQMRVPGYRDRIAHVNLSPTEGGMNLDMEKEAIDELAERGEAGVGKLMNAYVPASKPGGGIGWRNHRWARFRSSLAVIEEMSSGFVAGASDPKIVGGPDSLMETAESYKIKSQWQKELAAKEVSQLEGLAAAAAAAKAEGRPGGMDYEAPSPAPIGRISPRD